jgi:large-conductance mechanosensitive channel
MDLNPFARVVSFYMHLEANMATENKVDLKESQKKARKKGGRFIKEFGAFINRGSVVDMAVGVIIGGAFSAIVTALVNILLSICTWAVPGGLMGLVTVLPAVNDGQAGLDPAIGLDQSFEKGSLQELAKALAEKVYGVGNATPALIETEKSTILSAYTAHGTTYYFNGSALINWGAFINAIISFIVIAFILFIIVKAIAKMKEQNEIIRAKAQEEYYKLHPEERPAPVVPGAPAPTEMDVLIQIRDELKKQNQAPAAEKK